MLVQRWQHEWRLWWLQRSFDKRRERLKQNNASQEDLMALDAEEYYATEDTERHMDYLEGTKLLHEARSLDVETPPASDEEMWTHDPDGEFVWLSAKGRALVRRLIYEEQGRRLEIRAKRFNVWAPIITALTGLAGVILGIIALLHKK